MRNGRVVTHCGARLGLEKLQRQQGAVARIAVGLIRKVLGEGAAHGDTNDGVTEICHRHRPDARGACSDAVMNCLNCRLAALVGRIVRLHVRHRDGPEQLRLERQPFGA